MKAWKQTDCVWSITRSRDGGNSPMSWWREGSLKRPIRLVLLATCAALILSGLLLVPDLIHSLPWWVRYYPVEWLAVLVFATLCLITGLAGYCDPGKRWVKV